ncbi:hypothetical protein [Clostridium magnum]|uniref:Antitoxin n=1 Tax=Clostridium magnum DSM 2767 TaxID=1121326 RepID=A0A161YS11_9CLOT|nr:hypothetical protein [Clostridium magnum]KZL93802.1 hypothetical protein CLMAG_08530 [Clostridium magnum DSM 2767]SHI08655.1 hypothetical protein SAMN02745944_02395 [Clostridium magnum DSM 2767]
MDKLRLNKELKNKISRMVDNLHEGKEITLKVTPKGLKVAAVDIKIIK